MATMKIVKRRFVTLIEMMIVMFLIALITGVVAYNYRGSLDEGKAFKTKAAIERLETILNLEAAQHPSFMQNTSAWQEVVRRSPLVQNVDALLKDGWGEDYEVTSDPSNGTIEVRSKKYEDYRTTHPTMFGN
jgi:type II secretory pathway pseudopilin PulG